jgi:hypothetical protein
MSGFHYSTVQVITSPSTQKDPSTQNSIEDMRIRLERTTLVLQTLMMILLEKNLVQENELREWLVYVDQLDGTQDGRLREDKTPVECPKCKRKTPRLISRCIYCGQSIEVDYLFRRPDNPNRTETP